MKQTWVTVMLVGALQLAACISEAPVDPPGPDTQAQEATPVVGVGKSPAIRPQPGTWYYTCSADLLACAPGYGAAESPVTPDCAPLYRLKCVFGDANP
jgi:hypothetical protein